MNSNISFSTYDIVSEKIKSFGTMPYGWNFGEGIPANESTINLADEIKSYGNYYGYDSDAHLATDGGIYLVFSLKGKDDFIDVMINSDNTLYLKYEKGYGANYVVKMDSENVSINQIVNKLQEICNTSDSSTSETTTKVKVGLQAFVSEILPMEGFQLLNSIVPKNNQMELVSI